MFYINNLIICRMFW